MPLHPARIVWWSGYTILAVVLSSLVPGVDFFAPGFILLLQEERPSSVLFLVPVWLMLMEGPGSLAFGTGILWYGALAALFFFGHYLFEAKNFVFMIILGISLGLLRIVLMHLMGSLQDWTIAMDRVLTEALLQALIFPLQWGLMYILYHHLPEYEQPV